MRTFDCLIIGGGMCGLWTAYFLGESGLEVALVERRTIGSGSTGRSAGIVTTQLNLDDDVALTRRSIELYRSLECDNDRPIYRETSFVTVEPEWMIRDSMEVLRRNGVRFEVASCYDARTLLPYLRVKDYESLLITPDDGVVNSENFVECARSLLKELGVTIIEWDTVSSIEVVDDSVVGARLKNSGITLKIRQDLILTAGPWNKQLLKELNLTRMPTTVYTCQLLSLRGEFSSANAPCYFTEDHLYVRPLSRDTIVIGNGLARIVEDPDGVPVRPEPEYVWEVASKFEKRCATTDKVKVGGGWVGVCSSSPDGRPILGRSPFLENVYIIDGLDGYGLMRAPALAEVLSSMILGRPTEIDPTCYHPARFDVDREYGDRVIELY
ncbi:MAG: FAD-binding oxidoreductase [Aigarchaeota archaeon]|nr:FAD-binding oxidoreductase [Aigarchaeota archaeon]MDW8093228.1 FAD-binding oxidoreductase [Nitrososphaerota archaeon]